MKDLKKELNYQLYKATEDLKRTNEDIKRKAEDIKHQADRATLPGARAEIGIGNFIAQGAADISALLGEKSQQKQKLYNILEIAEAAGIELAGKLDALELLRS